MNKFAREYLNVPLEVKSLGDRQLEGYGSVFGNVDHGGDVVVRGAFKKSLADHRKNGTAPVMLWMHDMTLPIGVWDEMSEDDYGLYVKGTLADTQLGNETHTLLKMGAVKGLSIGYRPVEDDYDANGNRLLKQVDLWDVSPVTVGMNPLAQIESVKSPTTVREVEHVFRGWGLTRSRARELACGLKLDLQALGGMPSLPAAGETPEVGKAKDAVQDLIWKLRATLLK